MTSHSKSWNEQQDDLCDKINAALEKRKRNRIMLEAYKASRKWAKNREALNTMQFMSWHLQEPFKSHPAHTAQRKPSK